MNVTIKILSGKRPDVCLITDRICFKRHQEKQMEYLGRVVG